MQTKRSAPDRVPYYTTGRNGEPQRVPGVYTRTKANGERAFVIGYRASDGRQVWQTINGGISAARAALADVQARKGRGEKIVPNPRLRFEEAAEAWFAAQASNLRPSTRDVYRSHLDTHLLPAFGRRRLDSLDVDDVARLVARMGTPEYRAEVEQRIRAELDQRAGRRGRARRRRELESGYRAWTIRGTLTVAGRVFEYAQRRMRWSGQNPVRMLDHGERPRSDQRERRILTRDELERLIAAADDRSRLILAFAAGTGCRLGEVAGLKWRALDLNDGTATITHQVDRRGRYVELKTRRSRRTIELPTHLVATLRAHQIAAPAEHSGPDAYVFCTRTGMPHDHRNIAGRALSRAIKRAGLDVDPERLPTMHSFRHSFASAWIASGGDVVELSAHLGHRDPAVTMNTYSHEFEKAARSEARRTRLDGIFGSALVAADRNGSTQSEAAAATNVADLQAKRGKAR
jgi:integrase